MDGPLQCSEGSLRDGEKVYVPRTRSSSGPWLRWRGDDDAGTGGAAISIAVTCSSSEPAPASPVPTQQYRDELCLNPDQSTSSKKFSVLRELFQWLKIQAVNDQGHWPISTGYEPPIICWHPTADQPKTEFSGRLAAQKTSRDDCGGKDVGERGCRPMTRSAQRNKKSNQSANRRKNIRKKARRTTEDANQIASKDVASDDCEGQSSSSPSLPACTKDDQITKATARLADRSLGSDRNRNDQVSNSVPQQVPSDCRIPDCPKKKKKKSQEKREREKQRNSKSLRSAD